MYVVLTVHHSLLVTILWFRLHGFLSTAVRGINRTSQQHDAHASPNGNTAAGEGMKSVSMMYNVSARTGFLSSLVFHCFFRSGQQVLTRIATIVTSTLPPPSKDVLELSNLPPHVFVLGFDYGHD